MKISTALALVAVAGVLAGPACGGGGGSSPTSPGGSTADVTIRIVTDNGSMSYSPNPATVNVGQTVAWRNDDSTAHTSTANGGSFDTGNINAGRTSSPIRMSGAGSFDYFCRVHPSMVGTLIVR